MSAARSVAFCRECGGHVAGTNEFTYELKNGRTRTYPHSYKCPTAGCMMVHRRMVDVDEHVTPVLLGVLEQDGVQLLGGDPIAAEQAWDRIAALEAKLALTADQSADDTTPATSSRASPSVCAHSWRPTAQSYLALSRIHRQRGPPGRAWRRHGSGPT